MSSISILSYEDLLLAQNQHLNITMQTLPNGASLKVANF